LDYLLPQSAIWYLLSTIRTLLGVLLLLGVAHPVVAATPCAGEAVATRPALTRAQVISDTVQLASSMFVCRVDGAGAQADGTGVGTRSVTSAGLVLLVLARWLHFVGYALGFGTITFGLWANAALGEQPARMRRLWQLVQAGIVLLLCAEPLALLAQTIGVQGALFDLVVAGNVLASGFGLVWAQRIGVALLLWVLVGVAKDGTTRALLAVPALGLVLGVVDGAASAAGAALAALVIVVATLHEAAMGVWIGSLALLLALWSGLDREQRATVLVRFSQLSSTAIGVLIITGLALAFMRLTQPVELFATFYGATLIAKLLVALIAIGLATFGRRIYRESWRWRAALVALIMVLGVAGLLVSLPSP
jgi:copper transport protein